MKRQVLEWRQVGLHERPGLSGQDLSALARELPVKIIGRRETAFCERLSWISAEYRLKDAWRDAPALSDVRKKVSGAYSPPVI